jgi:tRNA (cytidine/uridine-2'-O-)-methyltransferase
LRRAGLDYHEYASVQQHANWAAFVAACPSPPQRRFALTTRGARDAFEVAFLPGDCFIFGSETRGLPEDIMASFAGSQRLRLPMRTGQRSLNLSNAAAVITYEAWRQNHFSPGA